MRPRGQASRQTDVAGLTVVISVAPSSGATEIADKQRLPLFRGDFGDCHDVLPLVHVAHRVNQLRPQRPPESARDELSIPVRSVDISTAAETPHLVDSRRSPSPTSRRRLHVPDPL